MTAADSYNLALKDWGKLQIVAAAVRAGCPCIFCMAQRQYALEGSEPFTCPKCGAVSYHPKDREEGYCGRGHEFTGEPCPPAR